MLTGICSPAYAHGHMLTGICSRAYAHRHMLTGICSWAYAHEHMLTDICSRAYAHGHPLDLASFPSSADEDDANQDSYDIHIHTCFSWDLANDKVSEEEIGKLLFDTLFSMSPNLKPVFPKPRYVSYSYTHVRSCPNLKPIPPNPGCVNLYVPTASTHIFLNQFVFLQVFVCLHHLYCARSVRIYHALCVFLLVLHLDDCIHHD
jgi:hypothetical protein